MKQMFDAELANTHKLFKEIEDDCNDLFEAEADLNNRLAKNIKHLDAVKLLDQLQKEEIAKLEEALKEMRIRLEEEKLARIKAESFAESLRVKLSKEMPLDVTDDVKGNANDGIQMLISNFEFFAHAN